MLSECWIFLFVCLFHLDLCFNECLNKNYFILKEVFWVISLFCLIRYLWRSMNSSILRYRYINFCKWWVTMVQLLHTRTMTVHPAALPMGVTLIAEEEAVKKEISMPQYNIQRCLHRHTTVWIPKGCGIVSVKKITMF